MKEKSLKIFHGVSIANAWLHLALFCLIVICTLLPFHAGRNYYACFNGFFGNFLAEMHPYFILFLPLAACVLSFFAVKKPLISFASLVLNLLFFLIISFSYVIEATFVAFSSPWIGSRMSEYNVGYRCFSHLSNMICIDIAFFLYAVVMIIFWPKTLITSKNS